MGKIEDALHQAFTGESKATLRLRVYAQKAEDEGFSQMARLFHAISMSEEIHGTRALRLLRDIRDTQENLKSSFESETKIAGVAYDEFIRQAELEGNKAASLFFSQSKDVEDIHAKLYSKALTHFMEERQTTYHICSLCGYIADGIPPEECPVCGAKYDKFIMY